MSIGHEDRAVWTHCAYFLELRGRSCLCGETFNPWALHNRRSSSYGWDSTQCGPKAVRNCLWLIKVCKFARCVSSIISRFQVYNKKKNFTKKHFFESILFRFIFEMRVKWFNNSNIRHYPLYLLLLLPTLMVSFSDKPQHDCRTKLP